jgi:hypothetical protein
MQCNFAWDLRAWRGYSIRGSCSLESAAEKLLLTRWSEAGTKLDSSDAGLQMRTMEPFAWK